MKKLIHGERIGGPLIVLLVATSVLTSTVCLGVALAFGIGAQHTRQQLTDLKHTISSRCEQRQNYDRSNHASVVADVHLYREILALQKLAPLPTDPKLRALSIRYRNVIVQAKTRKEKAAAQGVIGSCAAFR